MQQGIGLGGDGAIALVGGAPTRRYPSLDLIRGLAVLMVIFFHGFGGYDWERHFGAMAGGLLRELIATGRFGVNVFFVLSGYLITTLLLNRREREDYYRDFYRRRILRIIPVYFLVIALLLILHVIEWRFALASVLMIANFSMLLHAPMVEYGVFWSLSVEEHFYLLWPTCVRRVTASKLVPWLAVLLAFEPLLRLVAAHMSSHIDIHFKTPFVLDYIGYGAMLSLLRFTGIIRDGNIRRVGGLLFFGGVVFALVAIWAGALHGGPTVKALQDLPFTVAAAGLLLLGLQRDDSGRSLRIPLLSFFGYISYGLYLINVLMFMKLGGFLHDNIDNSSLLQWTAVSLVCIAASVAVSYLSRRYFEDWFLRRKTGNTPAVGSVAAGIDASAARIS